MFIFPPSLQNVDLLIRWLIGSAPYTLEASWKMIMFILALQPDGTNSPFISSLTITGQLAMALRTFNGSVERLADYTAQVAYDEEKDIFICKVNNKEHEVEGSSIDATNNWIVQTLSWPC